MAITETSPPAPLLQDRRGALSPKPRLIRADQPQIAAESVRLLTNADGVRRRARPGTDEGGGASAGAGELPPLLKGMLDAQAATGLPSAWLPHDETPEPGKDDERGETS